MIVVMPDSRTSGSAEIEQAVFGDRAEMKSFQAPTQADIPEKIWKILGEIKSKTVRNIQ